MLEKASKRCIMTVADLVSAFSWTVLVVGGRTVRNYGEEILL
jgi:hypothetical protein